jgi:spore coat protein A
MKIERISCLTAFLLLSLKVESENVRKGARYDGRAGRALKKKKAKRPIDTNKVPLEPLEIPKFVVDLWIPQVLYDDQIDKGPFEVSVRQIEQQMLPPPFPKTKTWAYGRPDNPNSYHHPASSVEVTKGKLTTVKWTNELVSDPVGCNKETKKKGKKSNSKSCNFLPPLVPNRQDFHWANPPQNCADGSKKSDCMGPTGLPNYQGPVPMITHVHGAHTPPENDGYAESWWLPRANNIPNGYATTGSTYGGPTANAATSSTNTNNPGYGILNYPNDQPTTSLWYHDHTVGMTLENVLSMGFGYWFIRNQNDGEDGLGAQDCEGKIQSLPGPPVLKGQDPNKDLNVRCKIREIPLSFQIRSFHKDGSIYMRKGEGAPDYVFDVVSVNGNTWPKLQVAQDRYRFRLLNGSGLRETIGLYMAYKNSNGQQTEVPFYVIGSDQGMLPQVAVVKRNYSAIIDGCGNENIKTSKNFGLILSPGERIDVIVDFSNLPDGTIVDLNITNPFDALLPPGVKNPLTLPEQAMRFIVTKNLCGKTSGSTVNSTSPFKLNLLPLQDVGGVTLSKPRDIAMRFEVPTIQHKPVFSDGARTVGVGKDSTPLLWSSPITQNPEIDAVEIWVGSHHRSIFFPFADFKPSFNLSFFALKFPS